MQDAPETLLVETKILGARRPVQAPWHVPLSPEFLAANTENPICLEDLIAYLVRTEVQAFHLRQEERRLLHVLEPHQISSAASQGKITMGGVEPSDFIQQQPDASGAVQTALQAFTDGLYLVFLDGQQLQELTVHINPQPGSTLLFIRLVALAGG